MEKCWFILVDGKEEGPYAVSDLKLHPQFNPDTLVRKEGSKRWVLARYVAELKEVFEDEPKKGSDTLPFAPRQTGGEIVIDYREDPPFFYLWLLIAAALLAYTLVRFFES